MGRGVVEAKKVFTGGGCGAKFNTFGLGEVERRGFMRAIFLLSLSLLFSLGCPEGKVDPKLCKGPDCPCSASSDCAAGEFCVDNLCRRPDSTACNPACDDKQVCIDGACRTESSVVCTRSSECARTELCVDNKCRLPDNPSACNPACTDKQVCIDATCRLPDDFDVCSPACAHGQICKEGRCRMPESGKCTEDSDCADGLCMGGLCQQSTPEACVPACAEGQACVLNLDKQAHECRGDTTVLDACHPNNLVKVDIRRHFVAQIALGLPMGFANSYVDIRRGSTQGIMGVDAVKNVAFLVWQHVSSPVNNHAALEALATTQFRQILNTTVGEPTRGPFTSWDAAGPGANAWNVSFQISGDRRPAERVNDIADKLLGAAGIGRLPDNMGVSGATQHVRAQYVLRDTGEVMVVMAVALNNQEFGLKDVAGGAALARYFDRTVVQCETSTASRGEVDFVFVVDDSGSMAHAQHRLSVAGEAMAAELKESTLNWRAAVVTSAYHLTSGNSEYNRGIIRGFTKDVQQFQAWLRSESNCLSNACSKGTAPTGLLPYSDWVPPPPACLGNGDSFTHGANGGCWIGTNGSGFEGMLGAARKAIVKMSSCPEDSKEDHCLRKDADLIVVIISDTEDQTRNWSASSSAQSQWEDRKNFIDFFLGLPATALNSGYPGDKLPAILDGKVVRVNAVYCPAGANCGDDSDVPAYANDPNNPNRHTRIEAVVKATGGILADIGKRCDLGVYNKNCKNTGDGSEIATLMKDVVERAIGSRGVKVQKPFIGASLRVAIADPEKPTCNKANVPRSRASGFDYDGMDRTVSFFGDCRPKTQSPVAISYRAWNSVNRLPCEDDEHFDSTSPDYCKGRFICDFELDKCICPTVPMCGGCPAETTCHVSTCTCVSTPTIG